MSGETDPQSSEIFLNNVIIPHWIESPLRKGIAVNTRLLDLSSLLSLITKHIQHNISAKFHMQLINYREGHADVLRIYDFASNEREIILRTLHTLNIISEEDIDDEDTVILPNE